MLADAGRAVRSLTGTLLVVGCATIIIIMLLLLLVTTVEELSTMSPPPPPPLPPFCLGYWLLLIVSLVEGW